jgi:hypothetical protein
VRVLKRVRASKAEKAKAARCVFFFKADYAVLGFERVESDKRSQRNQRRHHDDPPTISQDRISDEIDEHDDKIDEHDGRDEKVENRMPARVVGETLRDVSHNLFL